MSDGGMSDGGMSDGGMSATALDGAAPAARDLSADLPLVSCIMPTADRRRFVPLAIQYFLRQDYPHKELVILDDGRDGVADLAPADPQIRYERVQSRRALGSKRNACIEISRGDLIMHWDDDDWMAAQRIRVQVAALLAADAEICGMQRLLFYEIATGQPWLYTYPATQRPWLIGGTMLYTRDFWRSMPFPAIQSGEDTRFIWNRPRVRVAMPDESGLHAPALYVAMIHPANTSPKRCQGAYWSRWTGDLEDLLGEDSVHYQAHASDHARAAATGHPSRGGSPVSNSVKLNLGCCDALLPDHINVDLLPAPGVEVADLRQPWPWADSSVDHVRAWDIIEHLPDKIFTMNELWRVLKPGATAEIAVPTTDGSGAFQDPTHVSFWNRRSFLYYEAGNPYRERFARHYGITARFRVMRERTDPSVDGPRLTIVLQAVKP
jgi:hypothetical protein